MLSRNQVLLLGYAGRDADILRLPSGDRVASFPLATHSGQGEGRRTDWHTVRVWGQQVENARRLVTRGAALHIEGRLAYREVPARDGLPARRVAEVIISGPRSILNLLDRPDRAGREEPPPVPPALAEEELVLVNAHWRRTARRGNG